MRTFVKFDKQGKIVATYRLEALPEGLEHPYTDLAEGEFVLEVEPTKEFENLSCLEIHEKFKVDVRTKKLVPVSAVEKASSPPSDKKKPRRAKTKK